ncbi:TonB-dependent receptor [Aurantivibrio plasticivorans]
MYLPVTLQTKRRSIAIAVSLASSITVHGALATNTMDEIIVIGEKVGRSVQDTPSSVAVITKQMMIDQQILNMDDVLQQTPNVHSQPNNGFTIRGIDVFNVSGGGNSYLATVYQDNAPLPYRVVQKGGFSTWDVNQVEVLRGPQSTLQGRNALAGAIVVNTQDPGFEWDGKARVALGDYGQQEVAAAFGGAIVDDLLAFRISAEQNKLDGFNEFLSTGKNSDYIDEQNVRGKLLLAPTDNLELKWGYTALNNERGVKFTSEDPATDNQYDYRYLDFDSPTFEFNDGYIATQEISYDLDNWSLMSITSYSDIDYGYEWDGDGTSTPPSLVQVDDRNEETFTQEFRATFNYERFNGVVGIYYSDNSVDDDAVGQRRLTFAEAGVTPDRVAAFFSVPVTTAQQLLSFYGAADPIILGVDSQFDTAVKNYALFSDATVTLSDNWDLLLGARWDYEEQENSANSLYTLDNAADLPNPVLYPAPFDSAVFALNNYLLGLVDDASGESLKVSDDFNEFLPKVGVSYHWNDDVTTSLVAQQSYRSGGVGRNVARNQIYVYDAEYLNNYEFSLRSAWLDNTLIANANIYYSDWKDQQVEVYGDQGQFDVNTENAGESHVQGIEIDLQFAATESLSLYGGLGYAKTEFDKFVDEDVVGTAFANAPEWTGNLGITYDQGTGIFANANANYADSSLAAVGQESPINDRRTLVNAKLGYKSEHFGVYIIGSNIFDEEYISRADIRDQGVQTYGDPRQWSISLEASF